MKKYIAIRWIKSIDSTAIMASFDYRSEAVAFASLSKKNEPKCEFGVYVLDASVAMKTK